MHPLQIPMVLELTPAATRRFLDPAIESRSVVALDIEADSDEDGFRLELECLFRAFELRDGGEERARYFVGVPGGSIQLELTGGGTVVDYSRSVELPREHVTSEQRAQQTRMTIRAGDASAMAAARGHVREIVREVGETVERAGRFLSAERLLGSELEENALTWRLTSMHGTVMPGFVAGNLCLHAILSWPAEQRRTGVIRFIPEAPQLYDADARPLGRLKSALLRHRLQQDGVEIHAHRGIEMRFEVRSS